jgi:glutamyl-tRNA synthetase
MSAAHSSSSVVTRFAPSPTGHLHIGGARTALFCWAFARQKGGSFVLRIEDTDQARSSDESARGIMEDLAWLGIDWDQGPVLQTAGGTAIGGDPRAVGPFFQARRVEIYNSYIMDLVKRGKAYPAFEKAEELEEKRKAAVAAKQTYRYDRSAVREVPDVADRLARMASGEPHVIRLLAPHEELVVHDEVLGDVKYAAGEMDDFVIRKADGFPTYHFAVVIDDELMGVTHVMRAQEHLNNTPRHVALQRALVRLDTGAPFRTPIYGHMPLICNMDASKMSKRDKAKAARAALQAQMKKDAALTPEIIAAALGVPGSEVAAFLAKESDAVDTAEKIAHHLHVALPEIEVSDFREAGYLPSAICNFLSLLGWNPGMKQADGKDLEKFDRAFLAQHFSIERIGKTSAKFDRAKLLSFNADALNGMSEREFADTWERWLFEEQETSLRGTPEYVGACLRDHASERRLWLARAVKPRAKTLRDTLKACEVFLRSDDSRDFDPAAVEKNLLSNDKAGVKLLIEMKGRLAPLEPFTPEMVHGAIESFAREKGFVTEKGVNVGPVSQPLRVALAGASVTPPLGETMAVLGKDSVLRRLGVCLEVVG